MGPTPIHEILNLVQNMKTSVAPSVQNNKMQSKKW